MNLKDSAIVSVIIPTYKRAERLSRTIDSVLNQTFKNIEVIVVDDNSDGDEFRKATEIIMKKFSENPKVVYLKHSKNKNGSAARNTGIRYSKAKYVAFLDDDDYFMPTKIEKQLNLLEENQDEYSAICCLHNSVYKNNIYKKNNIEIDENGNYLKSLLSGECVLAAGSTIFIKRSVFDDIGYFDEEFKRHQDWEFLVRFFRKNRLLIIKEYLVNISVDGIRNYPNANAFLNIKLEFLNKFKSDIDALSIEYSKKIYLYQWKEVLVYFASEYKFLKLKLLYDQYLKPYNNKIDVFFIIKCIYLIIEKKIKFLYPFKYWLFSLRFKITK